MMGGTMFAFIGGLHYWWPKFTGKMFSEKLGNWACALAFIGFNVTFGSQFFLGVAGMPRRYYKMCIRDRNRAARACRHRIGFLF